MEEDFNLQEILGFELSINSWKNKFESKEYITCSRLNNQLFGMPFNNRKNCGCISDFFLLLKSRFSNINKKTIIMSKKFVIKTGKMVSSPFFTQSLTSASSDEDCIKLLSKNPKYINSFEKVPANWEEVVSNFKKGIETEAIESDVEVLTEKKVDKVFNAPTTLDEETTSPNLNLSAKNIKQLRQFANENGIALTKESKPEIIEEINVELASREAVK